jgi:hypothetical protein
MITGAGKSDVCTADALGVAPCISPCGDCQNSCGNNPSTLGYPIYLLTTPQMRSVIGTIENPIGNTNIANQRNWVQSYNLSTVAWGNVVIGSWLDWYGGFGPPNTDGTPNSSITPDGGITTNIRQDDFSCGDPIGYGPGGISGNSVTVGSLGWANNGTTLSGAFYCIESQMMLANGCRYFISVFNDNALDNTSYRVCSGRAGLGTTTDPNIPIELPMPPLSLGVAGLMPFLTFAAFNAWINGPTPHTSIFGPNWKFSQSCCHPTNVDPLYGCGQSPP